jgi:hypothetical protein
MKKSNSHFILLIALVIFGITSCVTTPKPAIDTYEISISSIEKELKGGIYDSLVIRFRNLDTNLTENEMKLLYYGQLIQPGFSGYKNVDASEVYADLKNKKMVDAMDKLDSLLISNPVDLNVNYLRTYVSSEIDAEAPETKQRIILINRLFDAILSTGDGKDKTNAIDVVSVSDEYFICYRVLYTEDVTGQSLISGKSRYYDKLDVKPNKNYGKNGVWFDITNIFGKF